MFFICKDRCMCTAPVASSSGATADPTVLYCFGEVVIPKVALREDEEKEKTLGKYSELVSEHYLQIIQLGVIVCLILFLITVLLVIKKDLVAIDRIVKKIVRTCEFGGGGEEEREQRRRGEWGEPGQRNDDISFVSDVS